MWFIRNFLISIEVHIERMLRKPLLVNTFGLKTVNWEMVSFNGVSRFV